MTTSNRAPASIDGTHILLLDADISVQAVAPLRQKALAALGSGTDVTLDCRDVERFDTASLQVLFALDEGLAERQRALSLVNIPPTLREFLEATGARFDRETSCQRS